MGKNVEKIISQMTMKEKAGQMIYAGVLGNEVSWPNADIWFAI